MINILKQLYSTAKKQYLLKRKFNTRYPTCSFEEGLIIKGPLENLFLEENVMIQSNVMIHLGGMEWCQNKGLLRLGENSIISPNVVIYAAGPGGVIAGKNFGCGPGVKIFASTQDASKSLNDHIFKPVIFGDNVQLGANVVVSPGVTIGSNTFIGAGSVVLTDIPANCLAGGIPAKFIKEFS